MALALPALAQQEKIDVYQQKKLVKSVVFQVGPKEYFVDNKVPGTKMDVAPFVENGRTFVPVRFLSNALGVQNQNIGWNGQTRLVTLKQPGFPVVELTVGKSEVLSNGQALPGVDVAPLLRDSRTFLPARFVANALGYDVDSALNLVVCWPKGEAKPDVGAVKRLIQESAGKPEMVKELEGLLGVTAHKSGSSWAYTPSKEEIFSDKEKSYFTFVADSDGGIIVAVWWARILSDIRNVQLDLSPIEKVLNWKYLDQPDKVKEIMAYARQTAESCRCDNQSRAA